VTAEYFGVFQEQVRIDHPLKLFARREMVFSPVLLGAAWSARSPRDGKVNPAHLFAQLAHQCALA
jgi:hypothetical protein